MWRRDVVGAMAVAAAIALAACGDDAAPTREAGASGQEGPATAQDGRTATTDASADTSAEEGGVADDGELDASGDATDAADSADGGEHETSLPDDGEFPRTISHKYGSTTIDDEPERIIAIGFNEHDFLLALGVEPVAVREYMGYDAPRRPWAQEFLGDEKPPTVGSDAINFEAVAAADPDLIIGIYSFMDESDYETLSQIAPTVAQSDEYPDGGVPWDEQMLATGEALGTTADAEQVVAEVDALFEAALAEHPEFEGATLAVAFYFDDHFYILEPSDLRARFFTELGFKMPAQVGEIGNEEIELLDHDVLVIAGGTREDFADDALLHSLDASAQGRIVYFGGFDTDLAASLGFGSPLSLSFAVETSVPLLAAAIDGDPDTPVDATPASDVTD